MLCIVLQLPGDCSGGHLWWAAAMICVVLHCIMVGRVALYGGALYHGGATTGQPR